MRSRRACARRLLRCMSFGWTKAGAIPGRATCLPWQRAGESAPGLRIARASTRWWAGPAIKGVVAKVETLSQAHSLEDVLEGIEGPPLIVVLDGVTDPHNLGAVLRSADAFGAHAVIAPKDRAVGLNATVEKVACGAAETLPYLMVTNLTRSLNELKEHEVWTVAADAEAPRTLAQVDATVGVAWVLGAEGAGLRRLTRESCDDAVRIPIVGSVESLNVSVSAGICLYETIRQRSHHG